MKNTIVKVVIYHLFIQDERQHYMMFDGTDIGYFKTVEDCMIEFYSFLSEHNVQNFNEYFPNIISIERDVAI